MSTSRPTLSQERHTRAQVEGMLREIGYALWIAKKLAAEIRSERCEPARPEMAEFCAVDTAAFAA